MTASLTLPSESAAGPQVFLSLQQNSPVEPVAGRHWYPGGHPSVDLQGAFAAGGLTAFEKQPANAAKETHQKNVDTVLE